MHDSRASRSPAAMHHLPLMVRALVPREMLSWALISVTLGALEGGLLGVLVKNLYASVANDTAVNLAVAAVSGAPAFANLISFAFANWARGRDKVQLLSWLMLACGLCVFCIALAPRTLAGLVVLTLATVAARMFWSGAITLRATVWRTNFPRHVRARITGQMTTLSSLLIAVFSALLGWLLDVNEPLARWLWGFAGISGLAAALVYRRARVRHHGRILKQELSDARSEPWQRLIQRFFRLLADDHGFRRYMQAMFVFGSGNLMVTAPLIILLNDQFGLSRTAQVLITASLPLLLLAVFVPWWARFLDDSHIIFYRARQSWGFVIAISCFCLACIFHWQWLLWVGSVIYGIAFAGGVLGWNLGHNDFSSDHSSALYMGVHVTLTGIRGLFTPVIGVLIYELLEAYAPGAGRYSLVLPLALSASGAIWFVLMARRLRAIQTG